MNWLGAPSEEKEPLPIRAMLKHGTRRFPVQVKHATVDICGRIGPRRVPFIDVNYLTWICTYDAPAGVYGANSYGVWWANYHDGTMSAPR